MIEAIYETMCNGFTYLFERAAPTGHWCEPRSTSLSAICLKAIEDSSSVWPSTVREWLLSRQIQEGTAVGSWGEEIWDTSMCLIALRELGLPSRHPAIIKGLDWIVSLFSRNGRGNWHDELWETSWALLAIMRCGYLPGVIDLHKPVAWLTSYIGINGDIIAPHYAAYVVFLHYLSTKLNVGDAVRDTLENASQRCVTALTRALSESDADLLWTGEAWSNGQILWMLCESRRFPTHYSQLVAKVITWFQQTQASNGCWLDVEDTASALLGLVALLKNLLVLNGVNEVEVDHVMRNRLRGSVTVPRLRVRRPFFEKDAETGYVSINLPNEIFHLIVAVAAFVFVGLASWVANLLQIVEWLFGS